MTITRLNFSRMYTARLETVRVSVSVATTRVGWVSLPDVTSKG